MSHAYQNLINVITDAAEPLLEQKNNYSTLLEQIGNARFVMIGEATHGTQEFYQARIEITQQLIREKNFMAVAIEGDWPDAYRIHRYLNGKDPADEWQNGLSQFQRFPGWMWRNTTMPPFLRWLRDYNDHFPEQKVGFYGLDLYSMYASMEAVIKYLSIVDPDAAKHARERYACFDHLKYDPQRYGYMTSIGVKKSCVQESVQQYFEIQHHALDYVRQKGYAEDEYFFAAQNARLVKNAEEYYRAMFEGHVASWNVRDRHMTETLNILADHLENRFNKPAKIIVWAHNSHVGDARATEASERGEVNIGQLVREQHDQRTSFSLGFSTYQGTVTAASDWGMPAESKTIVPGLEGAYEELFHHVPHENFLLPLHGNSAIEHYLQLPRLQRAIGVVYRPESERDSHYFFTRLPYQFDAIIHFDRTTALQPLNINPEWIKK